MFGIRLLDLLSKVITGDHKSMGRLKKLYLLVKRSWRDLAGVAHQKEWRPVVGVRMLFAETDHRQP